MARTRRPGRLESYIEAVILLAVAAMAGAASFTHVHDWTMHNSPAGTGGWFGWANAMVSELIPLAAGLEARRRMRLFGAAGLYPIALIIGAVALSLTGQFAEAKPSVSGWLIAAVPALGFLALVKLVLSSPSAPATVTAEVIDQADTTEPHTAAVQPRQDLIPASVPIPAHVLSTARFAVTNHHRTSNGQPITAAVLAAQLSVTPTTAAQLLSALAAEDGPRLNGHTVTAGAR